MCCRDGIDLNRAFPDRSDQGSTPLLAMRGTEPAEVLAITHMASVLPLTGAASLHEGAVVAVIPWDGDAGRQPGYAAAPDDPTFRFLAQTYADAHPRMAAQEPRAGAPPNKVRLGTAAPLSPLNRGASECLKRKRYSCPGADCRGRTPPTTGCPIA